jgi:hypothetical protein
LRGKAYCSYGVNEMNYFWVIKFYPGEKLLGTEVRLSEDVRRVLGYQYVMALCVFSSKEKLNGFTENVRLGMASQYPDLAPVLQKIAKGESNIFTENWGLGMASQYPDLAPVLQKIARGEIRGREVRFTPPALLEVVEAAGDEYYVALDPDTPEQQVWSAQNLKVHLKAYELNRTHNSDSEA